MSAALDVSVQADAGPLRRVANAATLPVSLRARINAGGDDFAIENLTGAIAGSPVRGRLKGTAIRPALAWFTSIYGLDALKRVLDRASPELRRMLRESDDLLAGAERDSAAGLLDAGGIEAIRSLHRLCALAAARRDSAGSRAG